MKEKQILCPYTKGELVIYKPTRKALNLDVMSSESEKLVSGRVYKVLEIHGDMYIMVEGYNHPGGGIYWTEFERINP